LLYKKKSKIFKEIQGFKKSSRFLPTNYRIKKTQGFSKKLNYFPENSMLRRLPASVGLQKNCSINKPGLK